MDCNIKIDIPAINKILDIYQMYLGNKNRPKQLLELAKTIEKFPNLPITFDDGVVRIDTTDSKALAERAQYRESIQALNKQINIESVLAKACNIIEEDDVIDLTEEQLVSRGSVDNDWILRFFNSIEDISNEEMQKLWAKILAGEIKKPKSFSLRTLETLKNLSQEEAELFKRIANFAIPVVEPFFSSDEEFYQDFYSFGDMLKLQECGLVNAQGLLTKTFTVTPKNTILMKNSEILVLINTVDITTTVSLRIFPITTVGKELYKIIYPTIAHDNLFKFVSLLQNENKSVNFSMHKITGTAGNQVSYEPTNLLEGYQA